MRFRDQYTTRGFTQQWRALQVDQNLDDAARARMRKNRLRALAACVGLLCLSVVLTGHWVAVVAAACFVVPCAAYAALIAKAPRDPGAGGGER